MRDECLALSREAFGRLRRRLDGLGDDEYFWEPAPDSWNVRPRDDGTWWPDDAEPRPAHGPITTIAWRVAHITDILAQERNATWLGLAPVVPDDLSAEPTAAAAIERLDAPTRSGSSTSTRWTTPALWQRVGPVGGFFADATRVAFVLHEIDELIHHGAEVALLRDLYAVPPRVKRRPPVGRLRGVDVHARLESQRTGIPTAGRDQDELERVTGNRPAAGTDRLRGHVVEGQRRRAPSAPP